MQERRVIDMTIDEAIEKYKDVTNTDDNCPRYCMRPCDECVQECGQVAEWLEELKDLREMKETIECNAEVLEQQGYNKALDDFAESVKNLIADSSVIRFKDIDEIAEQLKEQK